MSRIQRVQGLVIKSRGDLTFEIDFDNNLKNVEPNDEYSYVEYSNEFLEEVSRTKTGYTHTCSLSSREPLPRNQSFIDMIVKRMLIENNNIVVCEILNTNDKPITVNMYVKCKGKIVNLKDELMSKYSNVFG